jgi:hypothetical protein
MDAQPLRQVEVFTVKAYDPIRKRWYRTAWKMTREEAAARFPACEYEILESTKEVRTVGGDPLRGSAAHLNTGWKPKE